MQQTFVRKSDGFVCAIMYAKQNFIKIDPATVIKELTGQHMDSPPVPEEVANWIKFNQISSDKLKKSL